MGQKKVQIDPVAGSFNTGEKVAERSNFQSNNLFTFFTFIYCKIHKVTVMPLLSRVSYLSWEFFPKTGDNMHFCLCLRLT
jgi:hypothetical protein